MARKVAQGQEEDKSRVSLKLQKNIKHDLVIAMNQLKRASKSQLLRETDQSENFLIALIIINKTISDISSISSELSPEAVKQKGLYAAIKELSADFSEKIIWKLNLNPSNLPAS